MNWYKKKKIAQHDINISKMVVYRIGKPLDRNFYVTDASSLNGWRRYLGIDEPFTKIETDILYIPNTDISFSSWDELQSILDEHPEYEHYIFPEESGINHLTQFEIRQ